MAETDPLKAWWSEVWQLVGEWQMRLGLWLLKGTPSLKAPPFPELPTPPGPAPSPAPGPSPEPSPGPAPGPAPGPTGPIETRFGAPPEWLASLIRRIWPRELWVPALEVCYMESGWNPNAIADTTWRAGGKCNIRYQHPAGFWALTERSVGLFQINRCAHGGTDADWLNPERNVTFAYTLYQRAGKWSPWKISAGRLGLRT